MFTMIGLKEYYINKKINIYYLEKKIESGFLGGIYEN